MNNNVVELNEANFEREVLEARNPVLVQFWAGWSETCRDMRPLLEAVAEEEVFPVKVALVNMERYGDLADEYGVRAVPTVLIFNRGGLQDHIVGRTTTQELREKLNRLK